LHKRRNQRTTVAEIEAFGTEEWERKSQDWINRLILEQGHWVHVLMERRGWS
jgi:hypothetical protein